MFSDYTIAKFDQYGLTTNQRKLSWFQTKLDNYQPKAWQTITFHADVPSPLSPTERFYEMDFTDTQLGVHIRVNGISEADCKAKVIIYLVENGHITL